jgi:hypothetical protein
VDVDGLLTRWVERARLSGRHILPLLRRAWEEEGAEATTYGAVNAFTRAGTHANELTLRQRRALLALGGLLAFRRVHLCPRCFSMVRDTLGGEAVAA